MTQKRKHVTPRNRGNSMLSTARRVASHASTAYGVGKNLHSTFKKVLGHKSKKQKTTHKKSAVSSTIQSPVEGLSKSYTVGPKGPGHISSYKYPSSFYDSFAVNTITSTTQLQAIGDLASCGSGNILTNIGQINTNLASTTGIAQPTTAGDAQYNIFVKEIYLEVTLTNESACVADMTLYDLVAKVDNAPSPASVFTAGPGTIDGPAALSGTWPFAVPYHYPKFNKCFKIIKRTPIELSPGRSHKHIFRFPVMRSYPFIRLNDDNVVKGLHCWTMVTFKGMPLSAQLGQLGTVDVSLCPIKMVFSVRNVNYASLMNIIPRFEKQGGNQYNPSPANLYGQTETLVKDFLLATPTSGGNAA